MSYENAAKIISESDALLICAGAGMGVDSGLPDFRGNHGFWKAYPPYAKKGLGFIDMANPEWFHSDPEFAWGFYGHRLELYRSTTPHQGFNILLKWAEKMKNGYFVFTSNVDGHFQKAGFQDEKVIECHGSIHYMQCLNNCSPIFKGDTYTFQIYEETMRAQPPLPTCPECNTLTRPNILMFGDWGWDSQRNEVQSMKYQTWLNEIAGSKLAIVECGAGTAVPTVRYQSEQVARHFNGTAIRINVREPNIFSPHISLAEGAYQALSKIDELIE